MPFETLSTIIDRLTGRTRGDARPKAALAEPVVADAMTPDPVTVTPDMTLAHIINQVVLRHGVTFLPVVEDGVLLGKIDRDVMSCIDREHWHSTRADDVFICIASDRLLSAAMTLPSVAQLIARTGQRKFLVAEDKHLVGVLTLADLTRYLAMI